MSNASISSRVTHTRRRSSDERANPGILLFTLQSLLRRCTNSSGAAKPQQKVGMSRAKAQRPQREKNDLSFRPKGEIFSDRSHALGMTVQHYHLAFVAFWREQTSFAGDIDLGPGCSVLVLRLI